MPRNKAMKFNFAVFMYHDMPFMGYSLEIHDIFMKSWFIVLLFPNSNQIEAEDYANFQ